MLIGNRYDMKLTPTLGGMSATFDAQDLHLNRRVIIKTLQKGEEARRLVDEQKALLTLRSKHVVQLLDVVEVNGAPALVLEFIDGQDLAIGALPIDDHYLKTIWQIAAGLCDIHSQGVVHRDLKPNNIRRDVNGVIKIIDFGLSRQLGIDNKTQSAIGAVSFMCPELLSGGMVHFNEKVDVYAFAMTALAIADKGIPKWSQVVGKPAIPADAVVAHLSGIDPQVAGRLQQCLLSQANARPTMVEVKESLERKLLFDRHRARVSLNGTTYDINAAKRASTPTISVGGVAKCGVRIEYDGYWFKVTAVTGQVRLNNVLAAVGMSMPRSCVIAFEVSMANTIFATFDVSNPEVIL